MPLGDALIFYFPQMYTKAQPTLIGIYATLFLSHDLADYSIVATFT